ncbi:MAG: hypothetical protein WA667_07365 [Candidatus Nitrosopolaris sp.]
MITAGTFHLVLADPLYCDQAWYPSCYSVGYTDGQANPGMSCPSGHSDKFCIGWEAGAQSENPPPTKSPMAYAHNQDWNDGFKSGAADGKTIGFQFISFAHILRMFQPSLKLTYSLYLCVQSCCISS